MSINTRLMMAVGVVIAFSFDWSVAARSHHAPRPLAGRRAPAGFVQGAGRAPRPAGGSRPANGTARVTGRAISGDSGTGMPRAVVTLTTASGVAQHVNTGEDGTFDVRSLQPGRYVLTVTKTGYLTAQYGQRTPLESGKAFVLAPGEAFNSGTIALRRGAAIVGRLSDEFGEPLADALVQAMRYQFLGGTKQLLRAGRVAQTNDLGEFRIFGLMPGLYYVSSVPPAGGPAAASVASSPGGLSRSDAGEASGFAPTYFPGTPTLAEAQAVTVNIGADAMVSFAQIRARLSRLSGTVTDSRGQPIAAAVQLRASGGVPMPGRSRLGSPGGVANGSWVIANVAPGRYILDVSVVGSTGAPEYAHLPIVVANSDLDGLALRTSPGVRLSGRVTAESSVQGLGAMHVTALATELDSTPSGAAPPRALVQPDGSFAFEGLNGRVLFRAANVPAGYVVTAIRLGGKDITDVPSEFDQNAARDPLEIALSNRVTHLNGAVVDAAGAPVSDYAVVVFAAEPQRWGPFTRFVRVGRPERDGRFAIQGLPPGSYRAVAVEFLERGAEGDPEVLQRMAGMAPPFVLADGETRTLALKIAR